MKRRLTIARALINEPDLLLLDEPTTGLDPQARHLLWDRLYRLKQRGVTLVLTTHYMDEAEQLCDRLVVMDKAKIVAEGSPRELIERYSTREVTELRFAARRPGDARRPARRPRRADRAPAGPGPALRRRRRGGRRRGPRARAPAGDGARPAVLAGGRVPAPDRPLAGRLMRAGADAGRSAGSAASSSTDWSSTGGRSGRSIFSSFLTPVLFLAAMGLGPRRVRRRRQPGARRRVVPGVPRARPARGDVHADRRVRGDVPDHGRARLEPRLPRDVRDTDPAAATSRSATSPGSAPGCCWSPSIFTVVIVAVRGGDVAADRAGHPGRGADRARVRGADRGLLGDPADAREVQRDLPVRDHAAVPVLGHVLPGRIAARDPPAAGLAHAAVARRRAGPRAVARDDRRRADDPARARPPGDPPRVRRRRDVLRRPD